MIRYFSLGACCRRWGINFINKQVKAFRKVIIPSWTDIWPKIVECASAKRTIQLGSGMATKLANSVNVDINPQTRPDVVCDLNSFPYPFKSDSFDVVIALSVLEHLKDFLGVMGEIHRISKPGASVYVLVPHFSSAGAFADPTHCQHFSARSCDYFVEGYAIERDYGFYIPYCYRLDRRHVALTGLFNYVWPLRWLVNRYTAFWEEYLCYIIRGKGVFWELEVIK